MIRLVKDLVHNLLLILIFLHQKGFNMEDVRRGVAETWGGPIHDDPALATNKIVVGVQSTLRLVEGGEVENQTLTEMAESLIGGLYSKGTGTELIDAIVAAVINPYSKNVLAGGTLASLRKALLLPNELGGLLDRLKKKEMSCAHCGHSFLSGEIASTYVERDGVSFLCTQCSCPSYTRCRHCDGSSTIPSSLRDAAFSKTASCEACKSPKKEGKEVAAAPEVLDVLPELRDILVAGRRAGRNAAFVDPEQARARAIAWVAEQGPQAEVLRGVNEAAPAGVGRHINYRQVMNVPPAVRGFWGAADLGQGPGGFANALVQIDPPEDDPGPRQEEED